MTKIASCAIHPAIGIARVGNSPTGFFIGPEIPGEVDPPPGGYKDSGAGDRIKRQAARFRVFAFDDKGALVGELTRAEADITWTVQVANAKSEWDVFDGRKGEELPLDKRRPRKEWRNKDLSGAARGDLIISPAKATLRGPLQRVVFDDGAFLGKPVTLGEARTDSAGRLLVLAGFGESGTVEEGRLITHYANNDRWYDDIADGPVTAEVRLPDGVVLQAKPAWVVTAPPDFSPETPNVVTLYDVALNTAIQAGWLKPPVTPSFTHHIYPLLDRARAATWTNQEALRGHKAWGERFDVDILSDPGEAAREARNLFLKAVRNPNATGELAKAQANKQFMPPIAGDEGDCVPGDPDRWLSITKTQYDLLEQWAGGDFEADWTGAPHRYSGVTPKNLDRAALEACSGGAFYPGIEGGWTFRKAEAYAEPFRFNAEVLKAGDVSKRMAVPWQADFYECHTWWWPAQRPDDVLPMDAYRRLQSIDRELANPALGDVGSDKVVRDELLLERKALLNRRIPWARDLPSDGHEGDNAMVKAWSRLGFISSTHPSGSPLTVGGRPVLVETETALSPNLQLAEAFHRLANIERFPEFRPVARDLALRFLAGADYDADPNYQPFEYSPRALRERLDKIYNEYVADIDKPHWLEAFPRPAVIENLRQKAPFNLTDGAWLHHILAAGPTDDVRAKLFSIWSDEAGNGHSELNHSNVYDNLLRSLDIYLPPIHSQAFAELDVLPSAWTNPVFQMAMGLFPDEFLPELLGMTLYLEWESTPTMLPVARMLRRHHIDPQFYAMHAAIDNPTAGHGGLAREAVELHLDKVKAEGGEAALQREWRRIWNGYVTWATVSDFGVELREHLKKNFPPDGGSANALERMVAVIRRKAPYARTAHGDKTLGGRPLGALFAEPEALLAAIHARGLVDPDHPRDSWFVTELLSFHGPMYKVFSDAEIDTLLDWIGSLSAQANPPPQQVSPAERVRQTLEDLAADGALVGAHRGRLLPDGAGGQRSVADWFAEKDPDGMMAALADSEFIVKGDPDRSLLITQVFTQLMPNVLSAGQFDAFRSWIKLGCPAAGALMAKMLQVENLVRSFRAGGVAPADLATSTTFSERRHLIGFGAVH